MQLHFLGTGAGSPSKTRNVSSVALNLDHAETWLIDCGEGTQHTILHSRIRPGRITKILITHLHGDHIFGLPGLLCSRAMHNAAKPLTIYGPAGIADYIRSTLNSSFSYLTYPLDIIEHTDNASLYSEQDYSIYAFPLDHAVPSYGYRIEEHTRQNILNSAALQKAGIPAGPLYQRLKNGENITLSDGRMLHAADYLMPAPRGRQIVIFGDTRYRGEHADYCREADVLVHEATFAESEAALAEKRHHSTANQAATLARDANVKALYLTHISARYSDDEATAFTTEARRVFANTQLAHDGLIVEIPR
ncbi:MAG: ribonuclease Z [Cardiobacteriaceae bacterium]|nr:ribonuclease Z [Cardiobacteriaceae bacterium]